MPTVLVVDDDEPTREVIGLFLAEEEGYQVIECATGPEAVHHLTAAAQPLLVILDYYLLGLAEPLVDFIARTPLLHDRHAYVIVSAAQEAEHHAHGWPIVKKPFSLEVLSDTLHAAWSQFQQTHGI